MFKSKGPDVKSDGHFVPNWGIGYDFYFFTYYNPLSQYPISIFKFFNLHENLQKLLMTSMYHLLKTVFVVKQILKKY